MAFTNKRGENIIFECSELIDELKSDIEEFGGDKIVAARCKDTHGVTLYVNYDFIEPEDPIKESELQEDEYIQTMTMTALLMLLEQQDKLF